MAYDLARRGAPVTLLEKEAPAAGATSRSFAWINADFSKQPFAYHTLNKLGLWAYRLLEHELSRLPRESFLLAFLFRRRESALLLSLPSRESTCL